MSNPNRRRRPVWCGDVDTTRPGAAWDVQDDGCCTPCKPPVPGCRPPMPQFPDCGYHIPPVQYVPGMNEQEQLANLNHKMNELIELFNCNTDKVYGAYEEVVRSAVCNDAFYKEITVESGYLADASTSYELVHIPYVDCACQPIYMEMGLAYNNTTNSGVTESVFDKALEVYADKILPAAERSFQGVAIWKGAPIYSGETHGDTRALIPGQCDYTLGVTENGYFKIYDTPNDRDNTGTIKTMRQDKVRNSMGCAVIIRGGEYVVDDNLSEMELPCTVMAMNYKTKERFILAIGKDNVASDITPEMIANLLKKYDVDVAALTSWGQQSYLLDKGQFSFMPTSTDSDGIPTVPQSAAFWYITKRRNFHNDYVKEVAALTIQMGENLWYDELTSEAVDNLKLDFVDLRNDLEQEIQDRKDADDALGERIDKEIQDRKDADEALGERIDKEIADRKAADTALDEKYAAEVTRLDGEIEALAQRVTTEVTRLDALIQSTKEALTAKDVKEVKVTHDGTRDTYQVVLNDGTVLGADVIVYNYDQLVQKLDSYATVEQRLDAEIQARKDADDALNALITAEQQARANGDTALGEQIASVKAELTELIQGNTTDITALQGALDTLTQTVQSNYTSLNERVTSNAENIANLQGTYGALQATVAALNETVTGLQQSFASTEESFENVKQTVANMQTELNEFEARIEGELGNYLPLSGGTMSGPIDMANSDIHHVKSISVGDESIVNPGVIGIVEEILFSEVSSWAGYGIRRLRNDWFRFGSPTTMAGIEINKLQFTINTQNTTYATMNIGGDTNGPIIYLSGYNEGSSNRTVKIKGVTAPTEENEAATKGYVDTVGENLASEIAEVGGQLGNYLPLSGGTLTGDLLFNSDSSIVFGAPKVSTAHSIQGVSVITFAESTGTSAQTLRFTDNNFMFYGESDAGLALLGSGGVFFTNDTNPGGRIFIEPSALNKLSIRNSGGDIILGGVLTPVDGNDAANKAYVDQAMAGYLPLSGGQMRGPLDMDFENVENIRRVGFGEADIWRYYALFEDETLKLIRQNIPSESNGYFDVDCGTITSWAGLMNIGISLRASGNSTKTNPVLDITGTTDSAKVRVTNIATPVSEDDVATKGYVDSADEGFLYVDGGILYAHGTDPQAVLLDKIDFASQGVESGGIVSLDCVAGSAGPILSVSDGDSGLALLQAKTSDFSSNDDVMTLGAACKLGIGEYSYDQPRITTFKVTSAGIITGTYMLRSPEGVWLINVSGSQEDSFDHAESRLIGSAADITVTLNDALTMTITFSLATHAVSISKVIGIAPLTLEGVS